jgi:hypothetical protein
MIRKSKKDKEDKKDEDIVNIEKEEATVAYKSYYPNDKEV